MSTVAESSLDIIPRVRNLAPALQQADGQINVAGARAGRRYGDAVSAEANTRIRSGLRTAFQAAAPVGSVLAGAGIVTALKDVYQRGSDAQQAVGGVRAVFKQYADDVVADSKRADDALGLSRTEYQTLATVTGALLKNKGLTDFADQSQKLLGIGADLAAQYGGSTREAVEALNAALRGESDPIERYAISLNESAVNSVLAANGQEKLTGAALEQAKTQARLLIIQQQSVDAQGAFARESDTAAGATQRLSAEWANLRAEGGERLLPVVTGVATTLRQDVLPAVDSTASAISSLPPELKAAAAAFVAFKVAQGVGLTDKVADGWSVARNGATSMTAAFRDMRAEYTRQRTAQIELTETSARYSAANGRVRSSLAALRPVASSTFSALRSGASGVMGLLGGPWGLAFTGAAVVAASFFAKQQEAKARVDALSDSLDKQTGKVTEASAAQAFDTLRKAGAIKAAETLGISLDTLRSAALGNKDAMGSVNTVLDEFLRYADVSPEALVGLTEGQVEGGKAAKVLKDALGDQNGELADARSLWRQQSEFIGDSASAADGAASANQGVASSFRQLADETDAARDATQRLIDKENERRNNNLKNRQDRLALIQQIQATREEATNSAQVGEVRQRIRETRASGRERRDDLTQQLRESKDPRQRGELREEIAKSYREEAAAVAELKEQLKEYDRTVDPHTKAGQANLEQLYSLAQQWNNTSDSVKNARGQYRQVRRDFIESAVLMGDNRKHARRLADDLLDVPKNVTTNVKTPGLSEALRDALALQAALAGEQNLRVFNVTQRRRGAVIQARAGGGPIYGTGSKTSDSNLIAASRGEFMQQAAAVDYYGLDFMHAVNERRLPRLAGGGPVGGGANATGSGPRVTQQPQALELVGTLGIDRDGVAYIRGVAHQQVAKASDTARANRRLVGLSSRRPE